LSSGGVSRVDSREIASCGRVSGRIVCYIRLVCALYPAVMPCMIASDGVFAPLEPPGVIRSVKWREHVMRA
jgi:hypothetical protein